MFEEKFLQDVKINRFKLEEEAEKQPVLIFHYGDIYVKYKKALMEENLKYEKRRAELELEFRAYPERFLNEEELKKIKITEGVVEAFLDKNEELEKMRKEIISLNEKVLTYENMVRALEHRKTQLDNLIQLWIRAYYSKPTGIDNEQVEIKQKLNKR